jgi:signal transduction histidine kinase
MKPAAPSIVARVMQALLAWSLLWGAALGVSSWLTVSQEVDELLDDTLQSASDEVLALLPAIDAQLPQSQPHLQAPAPIAVPPARSNDAPSGRFVWQLVAYDGSTRVLKASSRASTTPLLPSASAGFSDLPAWRVYGRATGPQAQMLYVAQSREERGEARLELGLAVLLTTLPMAVLALLWLRWRVRHELAPLQALSQRLALHDPLVGATLGAAQRQELQPVHDAIDQLARRLALRVAQERAFAAHAAHALRTPLAGIDAQLAVALREADRASPLHPRLLRARQAAARLQHVVSALLALFRSGAEIERRPLQLDQLLLRTPLAGLQLHAQQQHPLDGDADLLIAALLNLLDNSQRHGATEVWLSTPAPGRLRLQDNGSGIAPARRQALRTALASDAMPLALSAKSDESPGPGLGLRLAELVARAHGGHAELPDIGPGCTVDMQLGAPSPPTQS